MRLTHLTLTGFKSFATKTTIEVTHNVTGIVGPNGSGKSNIAEALRFVLGEQSMKSMRGKISTDLLYKGSSQLSPASKTTVTLILDNRDKKELQVEGGDLSSFLVYDEIHLARTLYADGTSDYTINTAKVRLKDVQELLALAQIGSVEHLIISQGEADKLLLATPFSRKELIEDALGLRIFHIRLKESERKLERVKEHVKEVELLRKEIAPQLTFLEKEVKKIEKVELDKRELASLLATYSHFEKLEIESMEKKLDDHGDPKALALILLSLEKEMQSESKGEPVAHAHLEHKRRIQDTMREVQHKRDQLSRTIGRLEAERAYLEREQEKIKNERETITITERAKVFAVFLKHIDESIRMIEEGNTLAAKEVLASFKKEVEKVFSGEGVVSKEEGERLQSLLQELSLYEEEEKNLTREMVTLQDEFDRIESSLLDEQARELKVEREKRELVVRHGELRSRLREQELLFSTLDARRRSLEILTQECTTLVGRLILDTLYEPSSLPYHEQMTRKNIDRLKLRIEDTGMGSSEDFKKEYGVLLSREEYLKNELQDVLQTEEKLQTLVQELKDHIHLQFTKGIESVSVHFNDMFKEVFKGGSATLSLFEQVSNEDLPDEGLSEENESHRVQTGIDIKVTLPEKRIKDLSALSGGEKALTSIALSFALSQIAPPPFMVLDETDAPLDESNAKKYGTLLTKLSKNSKLLVITHNRETMSHCDMLYGITIGANGASKVLSISFDKAEGYVQ